MIRGRLRSSAALLQELRVFGHHTSLWIGDGADPLRAAREIGAHYVLRGSVRRWNGRTRVAAHLVDIGNGAVLWAEHYEQSLSPENLMAVQAEVAIQVANRLVDVEGEVPRLLAREVRRRDTREMAAYEAVLRYYHFDHTLSEAAFYAAMKALERAVQADPDDALVLALLSAHYIEDDKMMYFTVEDSLAKAFRLARRAVRLEPDLQRARFVLAYNHMQRRELDLCRKHAERTLELNPNAAFLVGTTGWMLTLAGDGERGLEVLAKGMALNPRHPGWFHMAPSIHHLRRGELEAALQAAEAINLPDFPWDPAVRASILARLDRRDEARLALGELLALDSEFPRHARRYLSGYILLDEVLEDVVEGLELAGMKTAG